MKRSGWTVVAILGIIQIKTVFPSCLEKCAVIDYSFATLTELKLVNASDCSLDHLPNDILNGCTAFNALDLGNNQIYDLTDEILNNTVNVRVLILFKNKLTKVPTLINQLLGLVVLDLRNNLIEEIRQSDFENLSKLTQISLQHNRITIIEAKAFHGCQDSLEQLFLSHNFYDLPNDLGSSPFNDCTKLQTLDLSFNNITSFDWGANFASNNQLLTLNLQNNLIENISFMNLMASTNTVTIILNNNYIKTVDWSEEQPHSKIPYVRVYLNNNPLNCDCHIYDLVKYAQERVDLVIKFETENLTCQNPEGLFNTSIEKVSKLALFCDFHTLEHEEICPNNCTCIWRPDDRTILVDCSDRQMEQLPVIDLSHTKLPYNYVEINLGNNLLVEAPSQEHLNATNFSKLHLSHNNITKIDWIPPNLQVLSIDNNNLSRISFEVLNALKSSSNLQELSVYDNPWECDCGALNFTEFLNINVKKLVNDGQVRCRGTTNKLLSKISRTELCGESKIVHYVLPILLIFLISSVCVALYHRYEIEVKVWLHRNVGWVKEEDLDKHKKYDVFICFHHDDTKFVKQKIMPGLESGPISYTVCIHERDWVAGEYIAQQINDSVNDSRRTLVVLSSNFLKSYWGTREVHLAHRKAINDGIERLIVVVLGELPNVWDSPLYDYLHPYLVTETFLKWGDPSFWSKMQSALPPRKNT